MALTCNDRISRTLLQWERVEDGTRFLVQTQPDGSGKPIAVVEAGNLYISDETPAELIDRIARWAFGDNVFPALQEEIQARLRPDEERIFRKGD